MVLSIFAKKAACKLESSISSTPRVPSVRTGPKARKTSAKSSKKTFSSKPVSKTSSKVENKAARASASFMPTSLKFFAKVRDELRWTLTVDEKKTPEFGGYVPIDAFPKVNDGANYDKYLEFTVSATGCIANWDDGTRNKTFAPFIKQAELEGKELTEVQSECPWFQEEQESSHAKLTLMLPEVNGNAGPVFSIELSSGRVLGWSQEMRKQLAAFLKSWEEEN